MVLKCPVCGFDLMENGRSYICQNNHNFDISKSGYVNLLPCNQKNSKDPGDSKEMIRARDNFLKKDFYKIISDNLNEFVFKQSKKILENRAVNITETGCGSGYYLTNLKNFLSEKSANSKINYYGLDISKHAINIASKADKNIKWIVASSYNTPFINNSQDIIINIFAPYKILELTRILKPLGKIYFVISGKNHLNTFREIIYKDRKNEKNSDKLISDVEKSNILEVKNTIEVEHELAIDNNEDIMNLLTMTPYYWNIDSKTLDYFKSLNKITMTIDMVILEVEA